MDRIFQGGAGNIMQRIELLDIVQGYFRETPVFEEMHRVWRSQIGGYIWVGQPADFRLFGNMRRAAEFKSAVTNRPAGISHALDAIPPTGPVSEVQYRSFVRQFTEEVGKNPYRSAARLLAMKRPDVFFAISSKNNRLLAGDFAISNIGGMNFDRYWNEIATVIWTSEWWRRPEPINEAERRIVPYRAAFMDVMYYEPGG